MIPYALHLFFQQINKNLLELIQSGKKIPENDVDVLDPIDTSDLYGMINDGINKHYQRDKAQKVTNNMVNITNVSIIDVIEKQKTQERKKWIYIPFPL